jgi:hypothetical protein
MTGHGKSKDMLITNRGPWHDFKVTLEKFGFKFVSEADTSKIDVLIANNYSRYVRKIIKKFGIEKKHIIYIMWEPKIVDPRRFKKSVLKKFGIIFSPSSLWIDGINVKYFNWPQIDFNKMQTNFDDWDKRKNKGIIVSANKFSVHKGELYTLRRDLAQHTTLNKTLDLYGHGWNKGIIYDLKLVLSSFLKSYFRKINLNSLKGIGKYHSNYEGAVIDKFDKIQEYKINVVIENSLDYVSEKLFDSVACGAITIYVGPKLSIFGLPEKVAISLPPDTFEISNVINKILTLPENEQKQIAMNQYESLLPYTHLWEGSNSLTTLANNIHQQLIEHS